MSLIGAALSKEALAGTRGLEGLNEPFAADVVKLVKTGVRRLAVKKIRGFFKGLKKPPTARPGIGSKVTKGKLDLGGGKKFGATVMPGGAVVKTSAAAAAAAGASVVALRRGHGKVTPALARPATQTRPQPARAPAAKTAGPCKCDKKLCCPKGTIRKVCFKRGRVKPRKRAHGTRRGAVSTRPRSKRTKSTRRKRATHR